MTPECTKSGKTLNNRIDKIKIIFHGIMVRIRKVEPEGRPARSGPLFSVV